MRIGIIGAGNVGTALGGGWSKGAHEVRYGVRNPGDAKYANLTADGGGSAGPVAEVAEWADVVVLATPWNATESAITEAGRLSGKIVVDCTNPLLPDLSGLTHHGDDSGGEQVARWASGAKVVKAFNTVGFNVMVDPVLDGRRAVMYVCGDDEAARSTVSTLATELGFEAVEAGGIESSRLLESFALLWISGAYRFGIGRDYAFSIIRR